MVKKCLVDSFDVFTLVFLLLLTLAALFGCGCRSQGNAVIGYVRVNVTAPPYGQQEGSTSGSNEVDYASGIVRLFTNEQRANGNDEGNSPAIEVPFK